MKKDNDGILRDGVLCLHVKTLEDGVESVWTPARCPPDNARTVLVVWKLTHRILASLIVARFGSEGMWMAEDHDGRLTYLDPGTVVGWQELPNIPEIL